LAFLQRTETANIVPEHSDVFKYFCKYHELGMTGELAVLPVR